MRHLHQPSEVQLGSLRRSKSQERTGTLVAQTIAGTLLHRPPEKNHRSLEDQMDDLLRLPIVKPDLEGGLPPTTQKIGLLAAAEED